VDSPIAPAPAVSSQVEFARQYRSMMVRAAQAKAGLVQLQRRKAGSGAELPDDVRAARDRLDGQLQAAASAMRVRDLGLAEQSVHAAEDTLTVIQQFLSK
jgi:hypothetical protein